MQQHLGRQAGVQKVDVTLVDGKVTVYPKEDSRIDPAALFKAVYDSGVSVAEMTVTATGQLVKDPAKGLQFKLTESQIFDLTPSPISERLRPTGPGALVKLRGRLFKKPPGRAKRRMPDLTHLEILEVTLP